MKLHISPHPTIAPYGIKRVVEALYRYLPDHGIELVDTEPECDLVNVHAMGFVETRKPVVYSSHGMYWQELGWGNGYLQANQAMVDYMARAQAITAVSHWTAHAITRGMLRRPHVIYHGVDTDEWQPGTKNSGYVLWNKARRDVVSDPADMNRLAELLPDVPFVSTLGQTAANVQITGATDYRTMHDMVQQAGVYLATARETFGIGTLEALACGVPVVGWDWGGQAEIIQHYQNGLLAEPGDYEGLAQAIRTALEQRDKISPICRESAVDNWQWPARIAQYADVFWDVYREHYETERPKVSVIVTAHNLGKYLPNALHSVLEQRFNDWECLIIDDWSTDNTEHVSRMVMTENPDCAIRYIRTPRNLKLSGARNFGFEQANGRYILHLDADDMLAPNALQALSEALDHNPYIHITYGHIDTISESGANQQRNDWPFDAFDWYGQMAHLNQLPYAAMMRREVLENSGGYRVRDWRAEDASFWCRVTSFGYRAAKVTQESTLIYRFRSDSKSGQEHASGQGDGDWTAWYPWRLAGTPGEGMQAARQKRRPLPAIVPFGAQGDPDGPSWPVWSHHDPAVSVIIPVGPKHAHLLVDALDSLVAQTFPFWEAIVVNDTGKPLDAAKFAPYARVVENGTHNIAEARNAGIQAARAPLVLYLDCDDLLIPTALHDMLTAYVEHEGARYIYTDWYSVDSDGEIKTKSSKEYDRSKADGSTHPITVLMPRGWALEIGGFDRDVPGWEDWEFFVKAAITGHCGQRLAKPLLVYRLHTGERREQSLEDSDKTLAVLRERYADYYEGRTPMAGCCGGNGDTLLMKIKEQLGMIQAAPNRQAMPVSGRHNGMARMEYTGANEGPITINMAGGKRLARPYRAGRHHLHRYHDVDVADVESLLGTGRWKLVKEATIDLSQAAVAPSAEQVTTFEEVKQVAQQMAQRRQEANTVKDPGEMSVPKLKEYLLGLDVRQLRQVLEMEQAGQNRVTAVRPIEALLQEAERVG